MSAVELEEWLEGKQATACFSKRIGPITFVESFLKSAGITAAYMHARFNSTLELGLIINAL